jgi:hypothetical protein
MYCLINKGQTTVKSKNIDLQHSLAFEEENMSHQYDLPRKFPFIQLKNS